jgi:asparagine synthase (glutamine-hydrolysing)
MCGIAGIIGSDEEVVREALPRMTAALVHRGPDDGGAVYVRRGGRFLGLGHARLAILDLSPAGHQPMAHPQTGSLLVYNGEIYNFHPLRRDLEANGEALRSSGDTEVLLRCLQRWGPACLPRLQGMYAFAWLAADGRLLLARDPLGIKPLYVARTPAGFLFASEVRALLASGLVPRRLDRRGMAGLLAYGAVQHPNTLVEAVASFPPGHWQWVESGVPSAPRAFFQLPEPRADVSGAEAVAAVRTTLEAAVRDHMVSDVPLGVFLSSGLDSTIVAGLAGTCTPHVRSFTVGFADHPLLSETRLAAETARQFGLDHTEILVGPQEALGLTQEWLAHSDQPSVDGLNIYLISKVVRSAGITVALSGQGGDELFGGYPSFQEVPWLLKARRRLRWLPVPLRRTLLTMATLGRSETARQKMADIAASSPTLAALYLQRRRVLSDRQMAHLGLDGQTLGLTESFLQPESLNGLGEPTDDPIAMISKLETRYYQGNMLLRDGDACSMAHGLELRVPMLDQRVLELALSLPGEVRLPSGAPDKYLLRQAFGPFLRPALLNQAKRGFTLPLHRWLVADLRPLSEHSLRILKKTGVLEPRGIDIIWKSFLEESSPSAWSRAFVLVVLGQFLECHGLS